MSEIKLVRTLEGYAACSAKAISEGSQAQVMYFIEDAKKDIAALAADNRRLREALEKIRDRYGPNHLSRWARNIARSALTSEQPLDGGKRGRREMRPLDQIDADYKKAVDAKLRLYERAAVVSLSVAIIGLALLFAMYQALAQADQSFKDQNLIAQEITHHG